MKLLKNFLPQFFLSLLLFVTACSNNSTSSPITPTDTAKSTVITTPTSILPDSPIKTGYNFDNLKDPEGWIPEEYQLKDNPGDVTCSVSIEKKYAGQSSLAIYTLLSNKTDADRHTKIMVDMSHPAGMPEGYKTTNAHNWTGKTVSMAVFIPSSLAKKIKVVMAIADTVWHNDRHVIADPIRQEATNNWIVISMQVGASEDRAANTIDPGFDPTQIISVQIWFEVTDSSLNFKGNIYLDSVAVPSE